MEDNEDCWDQHILELPVPSKDYAKSAELGLRDAAAGRSGDLPYSSSSSAPTTTSNEDQLKGTARLAVPSDSLTTASRRRASAVLETADGVVVRKCCESAKAAQKANVACANCNAEFCDAECFLLHSQSCKESRVEKINLSLMVQIRP